jgi:aromatic ring hydroxylase
MLSRTGAAYIARLREHPPAISMQGEQVKDVTTYPGLRNGVHTLA